MLLQTSFTPNDVHQAPTGLRHESTIRTIFQYEIGGHAYNPYVPHSDPNCYGPAGLCTYGLLTEFRSYTTYNGGVPDPHNPYQVAAYVEWKLDNGGHCNWPYLCR